MTHDQKRISNGEKPECRETVAMIPAFLSDSLTDRELRRFLLHVRTCPRCYKELETNYMVERTVAYLNEDLPSDTPLDLTPLLDSELEDKTARLGRDRVMRLFLMVIFLFTLGLIILFLLDLTGMFRITEVLGK